MEKEHEREEMEKLVPPGVELTPTKQGE